MRDPGKRSTALMALAGSVLLSGCVGGSGLNGLGTAEEAASKVWPKAENPMTVALLDSCPITAAAVHAERVVAGRPDRSLAVVAAVIGAIGQVVIPVVTDALVKAMADAIDRYADGHSASSTAVVSGALIRDEGGKPAAGFGCMVVVRGARGEPIPLSGTAPSPLPGDAQGRVLSASDADTINRALFARAKTVNGGGSFAPLAAIPEFYAEFQVVTLDAGTGGIIAAGVNPVFVAFERTAARYGRDQAKQLILTLEMLRRPTETALVSAAFSFGQVAQGSCAISTAVAPIPGKPCTMLDDQLAALVAVTAPPGQGQARRVIDTVPFGATVTLTEVQDGGDLTRAIVAALRDEKNRQKIAQPANDALIALLDRLIRDVLNQPKPS